VSKRKKNNEIEESNGLWSRLGKKSRVSLSNIETFEESRHFNASPLNFIVIFLFFAIAIILGTWFLIAYTPLRESIPGYPDISNEEQLKRQDLENLKKIDELEAKYSLLERYEKPLVEIINESLPDDPTLGLSDSILAIDTTILEGITFEKSELDSALRVQVAQNQKYALNFSPDAPTEISETISGVFFFPPLKGEVSSTFDPKIGHYGIDIKAPSDDAVKSTLAGTVIFTDWSAESGNVIHVQHSHNLVSVYKHNSDLLKNQGDLVKPGEPIAIIGNSGSLSEGEHLHFELWYNGLALDPMKFVSFE
jgi:murein DD-endopeptidase MepM/ murein hydrolase activator NlpD